MILSSRSTVKSDSGGGVGGGWGTIRHRLDLRGSGQCPGQRVRPPARGRPMCLTSCVRCRRRDHPDPCAGTAGRRAADRRVQILRAAVALVGLVLVVQGSLLGVLPEVGIFVLVYADVVLC